MLGAMAETGIDIACYWAVHNAFPPRKGDYGYLSSEGSNTPSYSYDVFPMFTRHFGTTLVRSSSSDRSVSVFASSQGKLLSLFLINTGRGNPQTARVSIDGFEPAPASTMWVLDQNRRNELIDAPRDVSRTFALELPPFSLSVLEIIRNDSLPPPRNLARDATPAASSFSTIGPHFVPGSATDGVPFTRWNSAAWTKSNGEEEQWFQLAWGQVQRLSSVRIHWGETHAVRYRLETSGDGVRWETLTEVTEGHGGVEERSWVPVTAQFLRLYGLCGTPGISAYSIREIEVY